jgi:hypothetical protein
MKSNSFEAWKEGRKIGNHNDGLENKKMVVSSLPLRHRGFLVIFLSRFCSFDCFVSTDIDQSARLPNYCQIIWKWPLSLSSYHIVLSICKYASNLRCLSKCSLKNLVNALYIYPCMYEHKLSNYLVPKFVLKYNSNLGEYFQPVGVSLWVASM